MLACCDVKKRNQLLPTGTSFTTLVLHSKNRPHSSSHFPANKQCPESEAHVRRDAVERYPVGVVGVPDVVEQAVRRAGSHVGLVVRSTQKLAIIGPEVLQ